MTFAEEKIDIEELAARWVARQDRTLTSEEASNLANWLEESTRNRIAYLRLKAAWEATACLAALKNSNYFEDRSVRYFLFSRIGAIAAALLLIGGISFAAFRYLVPPSVAIYSAKVGEHPTMLLSDGTSIQLNTNAEVRTAMTMASRTVTLDRGEAYFEVIHDENRPFVVLAGNYRITDLGTKFSVLRNGNNIRVLVTEGQVRIDLIKKPLPTSPVLVGQGNVVFAKADETIVAAKSPKEISDDLGWRSGLLVFNQNSLADAAEEFNRYNQKQIVVEGAARGIPIAGSFRADNIEVFTSLVHSALGLTVVEEPNKIIISK